MPRCRPDQRYAIGCHRAQLGSHCMQVDAARYALVTSLAAAALVSVSSPTMSPAVSVDAGVSGATVSRSGRSPAGRAGSR